MTPTQIVFAALALSATFFGGSAAVGSALFKSELDDFRFVSVLNLAQVKDLSGEQQNNLCENIAGLRKDYTATEAELLKKISERASTSVTTEHLNAMNAVCMSRSAANS